MVGPERWDWWNIGKDTSIKPRPWQPLTPEEQAKVIVIPSVRRTRFDGASRRKIAETATSALKTENKTTTEKKASNHPGRANPRGGIIAVYTREDVLKTLAELNAMYGRLPTLFEIRDYAQTHEGTPSTSVFSKHLGPKAGWYEALEKYLSERAKEDTAMRESTD